MEGFDPNAPSQGLGDTIAKITHATGLDVVADKVAKAMGKKDCGCNKRREKLNNLVPFTPQRKIVGDFRLPDVFFVHKTTTILVDGEIKEYLEGERVLIENENHPLFDYLKDYVANGNLERFLDKQKRDYEARQILQTKE